MTSSSASKLDTLLGLESARHVVRRIMESGSATHSVLFYGADGSGKEDLARILAEYWLCKKPSPETGADGTCQACGAYVRKTNPDLLLISPSGPSNLILIKQIDNPSPEKDDPQPLLGFFRTGPLMSRHKIAVISDAHRMNEAASNSLLKTLEEPFPFAKIILTTNTIGGVRPTILSRCLGVACSLPSVDQLREAYPGATEQDFRLAESAPGRLEIILKHPDRYRAVADFARRLSSYAPGQALIASEQFRLIAEHIEAGKGGGMRSAHAEALSLLALVLTREPGLPAVWAHAAIEAHRRVLGNASAGIVYDAMFARMLAP